MGSARKLRDPSQPRQPDELARLKIVSGPDSGSLFILTSAQVVVGRGDDADAVLTDLKTSRRHLELGRSATGWAFRDLGSINGVVHNGHASRGAMLKAGDILQAGETVFEFFPAEAATQMIRAPYRDIQQINSERNAFEQQRARVHALAGRKPGAPLPEASPSSVGAGQLATGSQNSKKLMLLVAAGAAAYFMFFDEQPSQQQGSKPRQGQENREIAAYTPPSNSVVPNVRAADNFFRDGFREFNVGNLLRARQQFEMALQIHPGHPMAKLYLENANIEVEKLIKKNLDEGKKALAFGRYRKAKSHFESVMRSLHRDTSHPGYVEAKEQLEKTVRQMKGDG